MTSIADAVGGSHLIGYRDAVITAIKDEFDELRQVSAHGGTFSEKQLEHYSMKSPCALVAILGTDRKLDFLSTGEYQGPVMMAAYVVAEDRGKYESHDVAIALAERIAGFLTTTGVAYEYAGPAMPKRIENLFSIEYDRKGVSIVALVWEVEVRFGRDTYTVESGDDDYEGVTLTDLNIIGPDLEDEL